MTTDKAAQLVILALTATPALRKATKFLTPKLTVKATRQRPYDKRSIGDTFLLTIGRPNFLERRFIRQCVKAGEPFPVKKIQLAYWSAKKR